MSGGKGGAGSNSRRHCEERSDEAIQLPAPHDGLLRCARNDGVHAHPISMTDTTSRSRGALRPRFAINSFALRNRGRREDRVHAAPAVSCAICAKKAAHEHTGQREHPAFPAQWLYGLYRALPGRTALCHRRPREALLLANLTPAPRRQDHTTSPYASGAFVMRAIRVHRIPPHVRDDRATPL